MMCEISLVKSLWRFDSIGRFCGQGVSALSSSIQTLVAVVVADDGEADGHVIYFAGSIEQIQI